MSGDKKEREKKTSRKRLIRYIIAGLFVVLVVFSVTPFGKDTWSKLFVISGYDPNGDSCLAVHFIDIGKADAILIECEGKSALIDTGTYTNSETIVNYIYRNRVESLDYVFISHPDKDHLGGLTGIVSEIPCGMFLRGKYSDEHYSAAEAFLDENSVPRRTLDVGDVIELGSAKLTVLGPLREHKETNDNSLVLKLEYMDFSVLFCGDIETEAEKDLMESGADLSAVLFKVPHHGSKQSYNKKFYKAVSPDFAVITVGDNNLGLPTEKVCEKLDEICLDVLTTQNNGNIVFKYDGELKVIMERNSYDIVWR